MLTLDVSGCVTSANSHAKFVWQTAAGELVGEYFPDLFAIDMISEDPEMNVARWEIVLAETLEKTTILDVQPREGAPVAMAVRTEKAIGSGGGYIVVVEPPPNAAGDEDQAAALQLFAERGAVGFFDLNLRLGRVVYSPAWKRMLGYEDTELPDTYEAWINLLHPEDSAAAPDKAGRRLTVGARPFAVEFRMRHKAGHWAWVQCVGLQLVSTSGELERVIGIHIDATERKEMEESCVVSDQRLHALADEGALAAFEVDFLSDASWFSDAWLRLVGCEPQPGDAVSALTETLPEEIRAEGLQAWLLSQAPGQTFFSRQVSLQTQHGSSVEVILGIHRTLTRKRTLSRIVGFAAPLPAAEHPAAENPAAAERPVAAAPRAAEVAPAAAPDSLRNGLLEELLSALSEGVIASDAHGRILFSNAAAARMLGIPLAQLTGRQVDQVFGLVDRQTGKPGDNPSERALAATGPLPLISEHALVTGTGEPLPIVWTARAAYAPDMKVVGVAIVFRNPEEMTLTPEELIKANRFDSLGHLAGGIAHDFNNLLTTILGGVSLARDSHDMSRLGDAEKACLTAKGLSKQLLMFSKGGNGTLTVCDPKDILDDSVKIASAGSAADITVDVPAGSGAVSVDRAQILQVFQNLIVNALQAMPPAPHKARVQLRAAEARVEAGQVGSLQAGTYVEFEVRDNGVGIKPEHLEKIWDPFFTTKKHGTGLGLATVLSIVRKHGGEIALETTEGVGTVFSIFLPVADAPVEVRAKPAPSLRFGTGRVLFMDDDEQICNLTGHMLQSLDYKFDMARNGEEAIALYKRYLNIGRPYDVVIMDLTVIGGLGGEETFKLLRELDPDVRAVVSSGYDNEEMARQFLDMGFCGYLTKPYRVTDLGKILKSVLG